MGLGKNDVALDDRDSMHLTFIFLKCVQFPPLRNFVASGKPVWGTCAGMILLANTAEAMKEVPEILKRLKCPFWLNPHVCIQRVDSS